MSGISVGSLLALIGLMLFGAQEQAGLVFIICGFVCAFNGLANQQEQKRLKEAERLALRAAMQHDQRALPFGAMPALPDEDQRRAQAVLNSPTLPVIPVSIPLTSGEFAYARTPAAITDNRQMPRLDGMGFVPWDARPSRDIGDLYITNYRLVFSGQRRVREIFLNDIASVQVAPGAIDVWRRGRPLPSQFGVPGPAETAAYIDRARQQGPAAPQQRPAFLPSAAPHTRTLVAPGTARPSASFITCERCGAANGLSANFCQNCAAPITPSQMPTLDHPQFRPDPS